MIIFLTNICYSQSDNIKKYYTDKYGKNETTEQKGKYLKITYHINDSITSTTFTNVKTKIPMWKSNSLKGHAYGISTYYK